MSFGDQHDVYFVYCNKCLNFLSMLRQAVGVSDCYFVMREHYAILATRDVSRLSMVLICSISPFIIFFKLDNVIIL